ncbi:hypothetical protein F5Y04DRAFT_277339 [Hypomontagnella monticulosa]|nr:hypothetical protein F5Y04DRAFT_277339 [Hypomontagnella monticulosa]
MESAAPDNLGPAVLSVAWVFAGISILVVAARFYVRIRIVRKLGIDDYIILLTLALGLGNSVFLTISSSWGLGKHIDILSAQPERIVHTIKWVHLCEFFSIMSPGFGRISYAFLLLSLSPPNRTRQAFLWTIIAIQFVVDVAMVCISFVQCRPITGWWDHNVDADCWSPTVQQNAAFFQGSVCSLVDLILAVFPASLFWNLQMHWRQKVFLSLIMGLGIFAMIASIIKTINLQAITQRQDLTYAMARLAIWWTLEAYLVLIAVSIPTIRPILRAPSIATRGKNKSYNSYNSFSLRNRIHPVRSMGNTGPFEPLQDPIGFTRIRKNDSTPEHQSVSYGRDNITARGVNDGIRKEISVSVTFDQL